MMDRSQFKPDRVAAVIVGDGQQYADAAGKLWPVHSDIGRVDVGDKVWVLLPVNDDDYAVVSNRRYPHYAWVATPGMMKFRVMGSHILKIGERAACVQSVSRPHVWAATAAEALDEVARVMGDGYGIDAKPCTV